MKIRRQLLLLLTCIVFILLSGCSEQESQIQVDKRHDATEIKDGVKLILHITVDQLRGDMPEHFKSRLADGGFRYLFENGTYFNNAHYIHANTETAVGHATLLTGAIPAQHGIVSNDWIDPTTGAFVYNTEDSEHHLIGKEAKAHQGVSPRKLLANTVGDELVDSNNGVSRVFSVSGKDRGAILPGGHKGKAFWYSKSSGEFVTSTYYYDTYPEWVTSWNATQPAERFRGQQWALLNPPESYEFKDRDDRSFEADFGDLGRTFPHDYGDSKYVNLLVGLTPAIDELTLDFALTLLKQEKVGQGQVVDLMAISLSATDYVGHLFGPASLEAEDNFFRLDRQLSKLFTAIENVVGLKNTLIVLSADHGGPIAPEQAQAQGLDAGRFPFDYFKKPNEITAALKQRYDRSDFILSHSHPYFYLNYQAIAQANVDKAEVEAFIIEQVNKIPGMYTTLGSSQMLSGNFTDTPINQRIQRNYYPGRSGAIHLVQDKNWFFHSTDEAHKMGLSNLAAIHGSPWEYDTHVPIFFAGHNVTSQTVSRRVKVNDIAPTLSTYIGINLPDKSMGNILPEITELKRK